MDERVAVVGLGYVGLPVAAGFARAFPGTIGFDSNPRRVEALQRGHDSTGELSEDELRAAGLRLTADAAGMAGASLFVVTVPTPIDDNRQPDLVPLMRACESVAGVLRPGGIVVFESTVYPGVTEEVCGPRIAALSGLRQGEDFTLGYSPERINPGDREHRLESIVKVVAGSDPVTLERVADAYGRIVPAGIHRAPSIKVAEAAKVIENTQRDLNIALMNELALIFDRLEISTADVLDAARTKWNFLPFAPGLVGGHCIGVDPYYLTAKAQAVGYYPEVILAGRRVNDGMGAFIAQRLIKLLVRADRPIRDARIGILGLTFKENVPDLRNSRVPDIIGELADFGARVRVHDPMADPADAMQAYGVQLSALQELTDLDALIVAVPHAAYRAMPAADLFDLVQPGGVLMDIKWMLRGAAIRDDLLYWSL